MKKYILVFVGIISLFSQLQANGSFRDFWRIAEIQQSSDGSFLVMENLTKWEVASEQQPEKICEIMDWSEIEWKHESKNYSFGDHALKKISQGDRVTIIKASDGWFIVKDIDSKAFLCCFLESFSKEVLPCLVKLDKNGYFATLSDRTEWSVSWTSSWESYLWRLGDCVVPIRRKEGYSLINFDTLKIASWVEPIVWKN